MNMKNIIQNKENDDVFPATLNTEKIINYRIQNRLTQGELAAQLDVTTVTLSRWEKNKIFPSRTNLKKMAKIMQVDTRDLIIIKGASECPPHEEKEDENQRNCIKHEDPQKAVTQILSVLFEAHNLISEYIAFIDKNSELEIFESLLNNSLILVRTQKAKTQRQEESRSE